MANVAKRGNSRIFSIEYGAGPTRTPFYHGWAMAGALSVSLGDVTRIEAPSSLEYGSFDIIDRTRGAQDNATLPITLIYPRGKSEVLQLARKRCTMDFQVHIGSCTQPTDFDGGWSDGKVIVFEDADITTYGTSELGALESGDDSKVDEEIEISALEFYEILPQSFVSKGATEVEQELVAVVVCDSASCGDCDDPSDGCSKVFAVSAPAGSSPGKLPEVVFTSNRYNTISEVAVNSLSIGEDPTGMECVGTRLVVISNASESLHHATKTDLFNGVSNPFTEVTTGFVASKGPNGIVSASPRHTWIVGNGGYVYFTDDPSGGVSVLSAGAITTNNLQAVDAFNTKLVVAVGASNTVLYSEDGVAFQSVTGPDVSGSPTLTTVAIRTANEWWVGTDDGKVWYTTNKGESWTQHEGITVGTEVHKIVWASKTVGYIAIEASSGGRLWRTISGGNTWYIAPEGSATLITTTDLNDIAVCENDVNTVFVVGESSTATDGVILVGTA